MAASCDRTGIENSEYLWGFRFAHNNIGDSFKEEGDGSDGNTLPEAPVRLDRISCETTISAQLKIWFCESR